MCFEYMIDHNSRGLVIVVCKLIWRQSFRRDLESLLITVSVVLDTQLRLVYWLSFIREISSCKAKVVSKCIGGLQSFKLKDPDLSQISGGNK